MSNHMQIGRNLSNKHLRVIQRPRVFISFSHHDMGKIALLRKQRVAGKFDFVDYSVKQPYDLFWKNGVRYRIRTADALILGIGKDTYNSNSVKYEYKLAKHYNKPVIAMKVSKDARIPEYLSLNNEKIIRWNRKRINAEMQKSKKT